MDNNLINKIIGWSAKSWFYPLEKAIYEFSLVDKKKVLELGAGEYSAVSLLFLNNKNNIHITVYDNAKIEKIKLLVNEIQDSKKSIKNIQISSMSAKKVNGKYNLIIMKSVLGGIFRLKNSKKEDAQNLIKEIVKNNLEDNGILVSMDNGKTTFESFFSKFGARKNKWRYFVPSDFSDATKQYHFGFLTNFSFSIRFRNIGYTLDNIIFLIDKLIYKVVKIKNPSIIVSIYKK